MSDEDKEFKAGSTFKQAISFALQHEAPKDAIEILKIQAKAAEKLEQRHQVHKCLLSIVTIMLSMGDVVGAQSFFEESMATDANGFPGTKEAETASMLLQAYNERDNDALQKVVSLQIFTFLDNQVAKLAQKLTIDEDQIEL